MTTTIDPTERETNLRRQLLGSAGVGIACALLLLATSPITPMAFDEGNALLRVEKIEQWAEHWKLTDEAIVKHWQFTTQIEGHPAFYGIVIAVGRWISGSWLGPLDSARFGPMMFFGLAAGAMFYRMWREYSVVAAAGAVGALMLLPRMFAHAHFASFDSPLTSCWILVWAMFAPAKQNWWGRVVWGIALGMAMSCKATGWFAVVGPAVCALGYRDRAAIKVLLAGVPVALLTFFVLNPPLWLHPIDGWLTFFKLNMSRKDLGLNFSTLFFGRMYNMDHPLPVSNTIIWTLIAVPVGTLALAGIGIASIGRRWRTDAAGMLLIAHWVVLLIVRAIPGTPVHDAIRLFLPSFAMLAALAGVGCGEVLAWASRRWPKSLRARRLAGTGILLLYAGSASSMIFYAPQWLSHYNLLIGGLPGATAMGMEPTYYWDSLDNSVIDWLNENTAPDERIYIGYGSRDNIDRMLRWKVFRRDVRYVYQSGEFRWYVMQHRPSGMMRADHWLVKHAEPVFRKTLRPVGPGPWRLDVPLLEVYDYGDYLRARAATEQDTP
ncbi:MAG TPA: hypothetical protein VE890_18050 [Thermoguttaceae bacterium]|nr:hypothetical protein [Thermoguttaceae bacterium]